MIDRARGAHNRHGQLDLQSHGERSQRDVKTVPRGGGERENSAARESRGGERVTGRDLLSGYSSKGKERGVEKRQVQ